MDPKELKIILGYDVEALKRNIESHKKNIALWSEAIQKTKRDIKELQSYILLIEESKIGHRVRPNK
jgi:hypothetical protein